MDKRKENKGSGFFNITPNTRKEDKVDVNDCFYSKRGRYAG